ncbi:MAG: hypothetical protein Edafosvirus1_43 [Edafosvirus sp.]|uniref:Uncharacterized protein n=1 Tax=Edafosvirus sp. TaxID=2487765 RepID=A0A3G4ZS13_9VIRU|nr:MAG: hypothetical protein Edafosvirus1_43 [Edafosvirus sp.]
MALRSVLKPVGVCANIFLFVLYGHLANTLTQYQQEYVASINYYQRFTADNMIAQFFMFSLIGGAWLAVIWSPIYFVMCIYKQGSIKLHDNPNWQDDLLKVVFVPITALLTVLFQPFRCRSSGNSGQIILYLIGLYIIMILMLGLSLVFCVAISLPSMLLSLYIFNF